MNGEGRATNRVRSYPLAVPIVKLLTLVVVVGGSVGYVAGTAPPEPTLDSLEDPIDESEFSVQSIDGDVHSGSWAHESSDALVEECGVQNTGQVPVMRDPEFVRSQGEFDFPRSSPMDWFTGRKRGSTTTGSEIGWRRRHVGSRSIVSPEDGIGAARSGILGQQYSLHNDSPPEISIPPIATFEFSPDSPQVGEVVTFNASGSTDPDGRIVQYSWDFDGDGQVDATSSDPVVTYSYQSGGSRSVSLFVTDDEGSRDRISATIHVIATDPPTVQLDYDPVSPVVGQVVTFDGSGSTDPNGRIVRYAWDFDGDGQSDAIGKRVRHAFRTRGDSPVSLTVTDNDGNRNRTTVVIRVVESGPPIAQFDYTPANPTVGNPVRFDASGSTDEDGEIVEYRWDFDGDGFVDRNISYETTTHTFEEAREYTVSLTVVANDGAMGRTEATVQVNARPSAALPPMAAFDYAPRQPAPGERITFNASGSVDPDGRILRYMWDFDDDGRIDRNISTPRVNHSFSTGGTQRVSLVVIDDDGNRDRVRETVPVGSSSGYPGRTIPTLVSGVILVAILIETYRILRRLVARRAE